MPRRTFLRQFLRRKRNNGEEVLLPIPTRGTVLFFGAMFSVSKGWKHMSVDTSI